MNAEQITAYLAATNDAKKWKSKLNKQLKKSKRQQSSTTTSSDDDSEQPAKRPRVEHYCYCHGTQYSHTSAECKVMQADRKRFTSAMRNATNSQSPPGGSDRKPGPSQMRWRSGEEFDTKSTPAPPEPRVQQHRPSQMPSGSSMPTTTHHPDDGAAFNTNFHSVNNSPPHANVASERIMSQNNSDTDPESTDEREEEHDIKHFSLEKRGDCIDNFMTYNIAGFKHRPSYEEILEQ